MVPSFVALNEEILGRERIGSNLDDEVGGWPAILLIPVMFAKGSAQFCFILARFKVRLLRKLLSSDVLSKRPPNACLLHFLKAEFLLL